MDYRPSTKATINADCTELTGHHKGRTFFNCTFRKLNGLTLEECDLNRSQFLTDTIEDSLGFTATINCHTFGNVELSPFLFDLLLCLLLKTKGNTEKRRMLLEVIGKDRAYELLSKMKDLE